MSFTIASEIPAVSEVVDLYGSVGWTAYTADPDRLIAAVRASHTVLAARSEDGTLIGMLRTVSDGLTIVYIQDILISPAHQRTGVGAALLDEALSRTGHIRQAVLLTDDEPSQRAFLRGARIHRSA